MGPMNIDNTHKSSLVVIILITFKSRVQDPSKVPEKTVETPEPKPTISCPRLLESCTLEDLKGKNYTNYIPSELNYYIN